MPELPDVELARRQLEKWMGRATIAAAHSTDRRVLRPTSPPALRRALTGRTVREVGRRGKWLRILLDDGTRVFSHLGMTGGWIQRESGAPKEPSERARLDVIRGRRSSSVRYLDSRRFGRLVVATEDIAQWRTLGPDPLVDGIRSRSLAEALGRSRRAVKDALMDQSLLAGIGNILVTEALWRARIDPRSRSNALSQGDVTAIARGLRAELEHELAQREDEEWDDAFSVYGRGGQPCPRCRSPLVRIVLGGRATTFCKGCQIHRR